MDTTEDIRRQAAAVARADCAGIVDGVHVDFRHPEIAPGDWEARFWWYICADIASMDCCGFLFPHAADYWERRYYDSAPSDSRFPSMVSYPYEDIEKILSQPRVEANDRISVEFVEQISRSRSFDHPHDGIVKRAHLVAIKPNGDILRPDHPLSFYGVMQLREGPEYDAYRRLTARILAEHGNCDPHKRQVFIRYLHYAGDEQSAPLTVRAALNIERAEIASEQLIKLVGEAMPTAV